MLCLFSHNQKDFRVKELRDFIKTIVKVIGDAASQDPEMSDAAQLYFSQVIAH